MPKIRPVTTAPFFLLSEINSSDDENCIPVMFTSREVTIIRQALFPASNFRTRLGEWSGKLFSYETNEVVISDFLARVALIDYKLTGEEMTDCFDSIGNGLSEIASALRVRCCNNDVSDMVVSLTPGGNAVTGDQTIGVDGEGAGEPPEGYESWEEYFTHKCRAASFIVDGFSQVLKNLSVAYLINFAFASVALGVFLSLSFPPAGIPLLVIAVAACWIAHDKLADLAEYIDDNRQDFVCAIYKSETVGEAIDFFLLEIDNGIEFLALEAPLPGQFRQVANALCDAGVFGKVFDATFEVFYPEANCDNCETGSYSCELENTYPGDYPSEIEKISENVWRVKGYLKSNGEYATHVMFQNSENRNLVSITRLSGGTESDGDQFRYAYFLPIEDCVEGDVQSGEYEGDQCTWLNAQCPVVIRQLGFSYCEYESQPEFELTFSGECFGCEEIEMSLRMSPPLSEKQVNDKVKEKAKRKSSATFSHRGGSVLVFGVGVK